MPIFPSISLDPSTVKASFREARVSEAVNLRWSGMPRGVYQGWLPSTTPGSNVVSFDVDPVLGFSILKVNSSTKGVMVDMFAPDSVTLDLRGTRLSRSS